MRKGVVASLWAFAFLNSYLIDLGVSAVELMPVLEFNENRGTKDGKKHWGSPWLAFDEQAQSKKPPARTPKRVVPISSLEFPEPRTA
jgi:hypothetical protein